MQIVKMAEGVLAGIRVLDLTGGVGGCASLLAAHGAEVVDIRSKLEGTISPGISSMVLDVDTADGWGVFETLAATAQVVVGREDDAYARLATVNAALVYAVAMESAATSGGDLAFGIMAALRHAEATGEGQIVRQNGALTFSKATPLPLSATSVCVGEHTEQYLAEMPIESQSDADRRALRDAFGCFATGVTVVTTRQEDGIPRGFTANSFTSVSLDPPMLLVCIAKSAFSCPVFTTAPHFAVNILAEDQKGLSGLFASRADDKFEHSDWYAGVAGMPVFGASLAHFVCSREKMVDAGDHVVLLGRVIGHATKPGQPLGYFRGTYFSAGTGQELVDAASGTGDIEVGALIAHEGSLLLANAPGGGLEVPKAPGDTPDIDVLTARFRQAGLTVDLDFLYSVYRDKETGRHDIFYHGTATGTPPQGHRWYALEDLPLSRIRSAAERSMLTRYAAEHREGAFGIYQGDETRGTVHRIAPREPSIF